MSQTGRMPHYTDVIEWIVEAAKAGAMNAPVPAKHSKMPTEITRYGMTMAAKLPASSVRLLQHYSLSLYHHVNAVLRTPDATLTPDRPRRGDPKLSPKAFTKRMSGASQVLGATFLKYKLPAPVTVYRGLDFSTIMSFSAEELAAARPATKTPYPTQPDSSAVLTRLMQSRAGQSFTLKGFTSTTASLKIAEEFTLDAERSGPDSIVGILQLEVPAGSRAIPMVGALSVEQGAEEELLLPHGTQIRIHPAKTFYRAVVRESGARPVAVIPATVVSTRWD